MEEQSSHVSSSHPEQYPNPEQADSKDWPDEEVLDLTGGAGAFRNPHKGWQDEVEEDEEEEKPSYSDSLEPSPEEEEPSSISEQPPAFPVVPSAPLEEEEVSPPVPRRAPTGSVDENLFTLPAASAPLMHSSADKVLDLQLPYSTMSAGQGQLASMLLEPASPPSLSPLSADSPKEQVFSVAFHSNITASEALPEPVRNVQEVSRTIGNLAFTEKLDKKAEADYSDEPHHKQMSSLGQVKADVIFSEKGYIVEHPTSQQESVSDDHTQLFSQSAKEMFSGMLKAVGPPHEEFSEIKETLEEQYVDFKPFVNTQAFNVGHEASAEKFKSNVYSLNVEPAKLPEEKYDVDDDDDLDLSDISPITPEVPESPAYEMFAQFGKERDVLGNKTDEKKMQEIECKATSSETSLNFSTVNPFYQRVETQEYVATKGVFESAVSQGLSMSEGLTPDIVQEAYESESHDIGAHKLGFESKIDLVQTATKSEQENAAKSIRENITPMAQTPELFEGTDSVSSPVLPDIVMEAPLAVASIGLDASTFHPDVSPIGSASSSSEEKIKLESEKPPSYEEAVSKSGAQSEDKAAPLAETKKGPQTEDAEAPYISIACDLIRETIPTESPAPYFSKALKDDFESPYGQHFDDSSPESEHSEPSYKHWEHDNILKEAFVSVKTQRAGPESEIKPELLFKESPPDNSYMESFQPAFNVSRSPTDTAVKAPKTDVFKSQEKPSQLEGFGFGLQSGKTPSPKYSPIEEIDADLEKYSPAPFEIGLVTRVPHDVHVEVAQKSKPSDEPVTKEGPSFEKKDLYSTLFHDPAHEKAELFQDPNKEFVKPVQITADESLKGKDVKLPLPSKEDAPAIPSRGEKKEGKVPQTAPPVLGPRFKNSVVDLLYWRDIKKSGVVFGASLFLLLSLTVFSIVSVVAYIALALLSVSISFRIYKGVLQAIQKSDDGHPFRSYLDSSVAVPEDLVQKYSTAALSHVNCTLKELRRLFLVEDLVDSLKFAVLMWVFTYIGALFNGLTLLILALISLFSIPVIYERHQTQIDHYLALVSKNVKNISDLIVAKIPGLKRKTE